MSWRRFEDLQPGDMIGEFSQDHSPGYRFMFFDVEGAYDFDNDRSTRQVGLATVVKVTRYRNGSKKVTTLNGDMTIWSGSPGANSWAILIKSKQTNYSRDLSCSAPQVKHP